MNKAVTQHTRKFEAGMKIEYWNRNTEAFEVATVVTGGSLVTLEYPTGSRHIHSASTVRQMLKSVATRRAWMTPAEVR